MHGTGYKNITGYILTALLVAFVNFLPAQTEKGKMVIGGNVDISESIQSSTATFNFSLAPSFGAFVINNFAIGGTYSFTAGSSDVLNSNDTRTTTTTLTTLVGPFLKYYIGKKAMKPFISANGGYSVYTRIKSTSGSSSSSLTNYDGFSTGGSVGLAYFLNQHISIESSLYLQASGYQTQIPSQRFGFSLGIYAFLDKKKAE
jgi:hypothetical protein